MEAMHSSCCSAGGGIVHPKVHPRPSDTMTSWPGERPLEYPGGTALANAATAKSDSLSGSLSTSSPNRQLDVAGGSPHDRSSPAEATSRNMLSESSAFEESSSSPAEVTSRNMASPGSSVFAMVPTAEALAMLNESFGNDPLGPTPLYGRRNNVGGDDDDDDDAVSNHTFYTAASMCESAMSTRPPSPSRGGRLGSVDSYSGSGGVGLLDHWEHQPPPVLLGDPSAALGAKWAATLGRPYDETLLNASASSASAVVSKQHSGGRLRLGSGSLQVRVYFKHSDTNSGF